MPTFSLTGENVSGQKFDQDKIRVVKALRFGLEVHFTNGRVIIVDGNTIDLDYNQLAEELNRDLKSKKSTGIHTYYSSIYGYQVYINNDRLD